MPTKNLNFALLTLFMSIAAPIMGMDNYPTFKEAQSKISGIIAKKAYFYTKEIRKQKEQESHTIDEMCTFKLSDIPKIAENNIDQGILLEQHFMDILNIDSEKPDISIQNILKTHIDKQQKLMGMIECASFIGNLPTLTYLTRYAANHNLIPKEMLNDTTVKSFYEIRNIPKMNKEKIKLIEEILPNIASQEAETTFWKKFDHITNDINTTYYEENISKHNDVIYNLTFRNEPEEIRSFFEKTSLPHKINLILRLTDIKEYLTDDITHVWKNRIAYEQCIPYRHCANFLALFYFSFYSSIKQYSYRSAYEEKLKILSNTLETRIFNSLNEEVWGRAYARHADSVKIALEKFTTKTSLKSLVPEIINFICFNKKLKLFGLFTTLLCTGIIKHYSPHLKLIKAFEISLAFVGPLGLTPLPQLYFLYQFFYGFKHDKKLKEWVSRQKNIQNLIEEFKESIKKEYNKH